METKLEDALNGSRNEPEAVDEPQTEVEQSEGRQRDENGRFARTADEEETGVEQPAEADEADGQEPVPPTEQDGLPKEEYTALRAVRDENKELKRQMAALQQQFASRQNEQQPQEAPGFWDDPDRAIEARMERFGQQIMQQFQQQQTVERLNASEAAAKARYDDYGDAFGYFQQAASSNPALVQQMQAASDPADFAYKTGKRVMELEKVGSLDDLIAQERRKWEEEVKAQAPKPRLPQTTATDGSVGSRKGVEWSGPTDLNSLLP